MPKTYLTSINRKRLLAAAGVAIFFLAVWRDLFFSGLIPVDGNMACLSFPEWAYFHSASGRLSALLWNPLKNMGEPFLADPASMAAYPVRWLFELCGTFRGFMQGWVVFHTAVAVVFMSLLAQRWYKDPWAALAAGLVYGFGGFFIARVTITHSLATIAWLPALLYGVDRKSSLGVGFSAALLWLAGAASYAIPSALLTILLALTYKRDGVRCLIGGGALALGLSAVQWIPFLEMLRLSARPVFLDSRIAVQYSLSPTLLLQELFLPQWIRYISVGENDIGIVCFYVGLVALGLAIWGTLRGGKREKQIAAGVGGCLLLSLGLHLPGYDHLFFLHAIRFPALWLMGAAAGMSLLCAAGLSRLRPSWKGAALGLIALDLLCFAQPARSAWFPPVYLEHKPPLADSVLQSAAYPTRIYHVPPLGSHWNQFSMVTLEDYHLMKDILVPSFGMVWSIPEVLSYQVLRSRRAQRLEERLRQEGPVSALWEQAGISTVVRAVPGTQRLDRAHVETWKTKKTRPPLYAESAGEAPPTLLQMNPGHLSAQVSFKQAGRVIFREMMYPGWQAAVDGVPTPLETFEEAFIALPVNAGTHHVVLRYQPLSFRVGAAISTMTIFGVVVGGVFRRLRRVKTYTRTGRRSVPADR